MNLLRTRTRTRTRGKCTRVQCQNLQADYYRYEEDMMEEAGLAAVGEPQSDQEPLPRAERTANTEMVEEVGPTTVEEPAKRNGTEVIPSSSANTTGQ